MSFLDRLGILNFGWVPNFRRCLIDSFEIEDRGSNIDTEIFSGYVNFISTLYVLPVVPIQLKAAGYSITSSVEATALACGFGSILSSYVTNLPFVIAPPTSVSIYLAVYMQQNGMNRTQGDTAVILSGCALLMIGLFKPLTSFVTRLIPDCIQASTAVGIGLLTALAGAIELKLVVPGKYTVVEMGPMTSSILIAMLSTCIIAWATHYRVKGAFMIGLLFGTFAWWTLEGKWPDSIVRLPQLDIDFDINVDSKSLSLLSNLVFLHVLTLCGIARSMSDMAGLTFSDQSIPRGNWLFIMCGFATILSGYLSGPPILISPETAGGIQAGAKTGLSSLVCGLLYLFAIFCCPFFSAVPAAGTSPLLILVGMTLFMNSSRIKWSSALESIPAFFVIILIPFTYSILGGVSIGYALYFTIGIISGDLWDKIILMWSRLRGYRFSLQNLLLLLLSLKDSCVEFLTFENDLMDDEQLQQQSQRITEDEFVMLNISEDSAPRLARSNSLLNLERQSMDLTNGIKSMQSVILV